MSGNSEYSLLAKGLVERIGLESGILTHKVDGREKYEIEMPIENHTVGIRKVLDILIDKKLGIMDSLEEIQAVGHRVAHGGEFFSSSTLINKEVIEKIEKLCELAPLHNPANLLGIHAIETLLPGRNRLPFLIHPSIRQCLIIPICSDTIRILYNI